MNIPFLDLAAQYAGIRAEIDDAIAAVIRDSAFISGPYVNTSNRGALPRRLPDGPSDPVFAENFVRGI